MSFISGVNAGHYTCYVKNPITGSWQYCNDETIEERQPSLEDAENVYILFYQRKGNTLQTLLCHEWSRSLQNVD